MKILTRDDTAHDVEYVTLAEAAKESAVWEHEAKILRDELKSEYEKATDWFISYRSSDGIRRHSNSDTKWPVLTKTPHRKNDQSPSVDATEKAK